jgi:oligopeptide transport system substrate-binding protein
MFSPEETMRIKRIIAFLLCLLLTLAFISGCTLFHTSEPSPSPSPSPTPPPATPAPTPEPTEAPRADYHTLNLSTDAMPACWNVHNWQSETDYLISSMITAPLVEIGLTEDEDGLPADSWIFTMAESVEDVTGSWEGAADWGIAASEQGRVWRIRLRGGVCWDDEDSTPVTADTYLYSMRQLLSPEMENYRSAAFCSGGGALLGADAYRHSGADVWQENALPGGGFTYPAEEWRFGEDGVCTGADGTPLFFSLQGPLDVWLSGNSLEDYYRAGYVPEEVYAGLSALADEAGYVPVTEETMALLYSFTGSDAWGREIQEDLAYYTAFRRTWPKVEWDSVGLIKEDDYTLLYICAGETDQFDLLYALTTPWLVYEPLYEGGKFAYGGRWYTSYGTSPETSMSCGPYRLTEMGERSLTLEKNEVWCSRCAGDGCYETDRVILELLSRSEAEKRFREGKLDLLLPAEGEPLPEIDGATALLQDDAYTYRFFMVTDKEALFDLQVAASVALGKPINKTCLSNDAFREALSYALDRAAFAAALEEGCRPQLGVISDLYLYDVTHDLSSIYRTSPWGMTAICSAYGLSVAGETDLRGTYESCTGYDLGRARHLFQLAWEQMTEAELWTEDMTILLDCAVSAGELTEARKQQNELLQKMLEDAAEGTPFEGKLRLRFCAREDRYTAVAEGEIEMGFGAWGGAAFDPYGLMQCYCDPGFNTIQEGCGFQPDEKLLTLLVEEEPVTKTYTEWCHALLPGGEYADEPLRRVEVLSMLEEALLKEHRFIVTASGARELLLSPKLEAGSEKYSILSSFGGIRSLKYRYDDAQWAARD